MKPSQVLTSVCKECDKAVSSKTEWLKALNYVLKVSERSEHLVIALIGTERLAKELARFPIVVQLEILARCFNEFGDTISRMFNNKPV